MLVFSNVIEQLISATLLKINSIIDSSRDLSGFLIISYQLLLFLSKPFVASAIRKYVKYFDLRLTFCIIGNESWYGTTSKIISNTG